jgi:hypothetical protein
MIHWEVAYSVKNATDQLMKDLVLIASGSGGNGADYGCT